MVGYFIAKHVYKIMFNGSSVSVLVVILHSSIQGCFPEEKKVKIGPGSISYTTVCSRPEDGLRCRQGVKPPLKLKLNLALPCFDGV